MIEHTYTKQPLYRHIARLLQWRETVSESYIGVCEARIERALKHLPHGSGIDGLCTLDGDRSTPQRLVFVFDFHHMDENGFYSHWTSHTVTVKPCLVDGMHLRITKARCDDHWLDYMYDVWNYALRAEKEYDL